jgi:small GTP-binding protein
LRADNSSAIDELTNLLLSTDRAVLGGVLIAVLLVIFTIVFFAVRGSSSSRRAILLVGLCDAGKSLLFSRLIYRKFTATQTSMIENTGTYSCDEKKRSVKLVDIPGHDRVRQQYFDKVKMTARGVIFVIDSLTFQKDIKDIAELMYQILSDKVIMKNAPSVLVACNKHDQGLAKGSRLIQSALEKELNNVRRTRSAALQATDGAIAASFIGRRDRDFTFSDVRPIHVEFVECSAGQNDGGTGCQLKEVEDWLAKLA